MFNICFFLCSLFSPLPFFSFLFILSHFLQYFIPFSFSPRLLLSVCQWFPEKKKKKFKNFKRFEAHGFHCQVKTFSSSMKSIKFCKSFWNTLYSVTGWLFQCSPLRKKLPRCKFRRQRFQRCFHQSQLRVSQEDTKRYKFRKYSKQNIAFDKLNKAAKNVQSTCRKSW